MKSIAGGPVMAQQLTNLTSILEDAGSIPGLASLTLLRMDMDQE